MSQTIALQARAPQVSLSEIVDQVQRQRQNELRIQEMQREAPLHAQQVQQKLDYGNALDRYRSGMAEGDPAAIEELDAYPEEQKKLHDAFDGMTPEQYRKASDTAQAFANAARRVSSFGEGTPEQAQAWQVEIDKLYQGGYIDQQYADLYKKQGPNMALVNEALQLGKFAESYTGKNAVTRARAANLEGKTENEEALTQARVGTEKSKAELNTVRGKVAQENVNSLDKYRVGSVEQKAEAAAAETERKTKGQEAETERKAAKDAMPPKPRTAAPQDPNKARNTALTVEQKIENLLRNKRKALDIEESDIATAESGRADNMADVDALTNFNDTKRRVEEYRAYEANLRKQGGPTQAADGKKPLGASGDQDGSRAKPYTPKSRDEAQKLPAGAWFMDPKGNLIQKQ